MKIERLYKYGRVNKYSEALFSGNEVYFASAESLNDPFECCVYYTGDATEDQLIVLVAGGNMKQGIRESDAYDKAKKVVEHSRGKHKEIFQDIREATIKEYRQKYGLYCMSEKRDNILMFSHYGDRHRGYCLEFDASDTELFFGEARRVIYTDKYPIADFFNPPQDEEIDKVFLTKFTDWGYEKEWRIINHISGTGLKEYPKEHLRGVIFGMFMNDKDKEMVRSWLRDRGGDVQLYQAYQQKDAFFLNIQQVD